MATPSLARKRGKGAIPPLENGDRLTRVEFERRWDAMPDLKRAELIEGVVHLPGPVRHTIHGEPCADLLGWLGHYHAFTAGTEAAAHSSVRLDDLNELQPDGLLLIEPNCGGQTRINLDDILEGGPEVAAEVATTEASIEFHAKMEVYRRHGVREYLVWRVLDEAVDWFVLRGGRFERLIPSSDGLYRSTVFPGLWLDHAALLADNIARVLEVVKHGVASSEHNDFVQRLKAKKP